MYCSQCGVQLAPNAGFCGACGAPVGLAVGAESSLKRPAIISVLAVLHFVGAPMLLLVALVAMGSVASSDAALPEAVVGVLLGGLGLMQLACGIGLWKLKPYGRTLQLMFAWIGLIGVPIGTIISILILIYLFKPGIKALFSGKPATELTADELAQIAVVSQGSQLATAIVVLLVALLSIAVVGIIAAIAVPGLLRARMSGNEASAIGSLRAISSAQSTFAASCGGGFYSPSLARLAPPPTASGGSSVGFIGMDLSTDPSTNSGYMIVMTPGATIAGAPASCNGAAAGTLVETYFVSAAPTAGAGTRYFGMNQDGTIYQSTAPVAVTQAGRTAIFVAVSAARRHHVASG